MKTPKTQEKGKNLAASAGGKITKNKAKGKNPMDPAKVKLGLQKAKDTVKVQDGKNLQKKGEMKNKVFNGKVSPAAVNGSAAGPLKVKGGKKRKSDEGVKPESVVNEKTSKKNKGVVKSPEVKLGLKIEKLLESPKTGGPKKNKKKGKGGGNAKQNVPQGETPTAGSPGKNQKKMKKKGPKGSPVGSKPTGIKRVPEKKDPASWDTPVPLGPFPERSNVENAIKALLKNLKEHKAKKPALLDAYDPLLVCVDFFKKPEGRRIQRTVLPHHYLGDNPEILFVVTDMKKANKEYEESIEAHKELFKTRGVTNISEIIPWRKLCYEYTQFEEKRKLANRGDAFLIDSKLSHRWPAIMRKKIFKKKIPIPVRVDKTSDLKKNVEIAIKKVALVLGSNSFSISPQFGHSKMSVKALADNLITIVTVLCDTHKYPGGRPNIRSINIRGTKSEAFPVFISSASPNTVVSTKPQKKKKREVVKGEVTTAGVTVAVHPSGNVRILSKDEDDDDETEHETSPKKKKVIKGKADSDDDLEDDDSEGESDDEEDSEIDPEFLEQFKKANKASEGESSDDEQIEKAEQEFLAALRKQQDTLEAEAQAKGKKGGKKAPVVKEESSDDEDDLDDDEDDLDEDDDDDVPDLIPAKKSKPQAQQPKKGKNAKQPPVRGNPAQNGVGKKKQGKGKPGSPKGKPGVAAQSPKGGAGKKGPQGGKGNANQKGNNKASPKAQQRYFNKGGKKK